jgi:hypothetical protein
VYQRDELVDNERQLTMIVKAIQALQYLIRDPFGTARVDTTS